MYECIICTESFDNETRYNCIGCCDHDGVCSICYFRLRFLLREFSCPMCKQSLERVICINQPGVKFSDFNIWGDNAGPGYSLDYRSRIFFPMNYASRVIEPLLLCKCPVCEVSNGDPKKMHDHVKQHNLRFCVLCIDNKKAFPCEQRIFKVNELDVHMRQGDGDGNLGHPSCQFCKKRFYDNTALFIHLEKDHESCHVCKKEGHRYRYFQNYHALESHFENTHYPCRDPSCLEKKFVVFADELELISHMLNNHPGVQVNRRLPVAFLRHRASEDQLDSQGRTGDDRYDGGVRGRVRHGEWQVEVVPPPPDPRESQRREQSKKKSSEESRIVESTHSEDVTVPDLSTMNYPTLPTPTTSSGKTAGNTNWMKQPSKKSHANKLFSAESTSSSKFRDVLDPQSLLSTKYYGQKETSTRPASTKESASSAPRSNMKPSQSFNVLSSVDDFPPPPPPSTTATATATSSSSSNGGKKSKPKHGTDWNLAIITGNASSKGLKAIKTKSISSASAKGPRTGEEATTMTMTMTTTRSTEDFEGLVLLRPLDVEEEEYIRVPKSNLKDASQFREVSSKSEASPSPPKQSLSMAVSPLSLHVSSVPPGFENISYQQSRSGESSPMTYAAGRQVSQQPLPPPPGFSALNPFMDAMTIANSPQSDRPPHLSEPARDLSAGTETGLKGDPSKISTGIQEMSAMSNKDRPSKTSYEKSTTTTVQNKTDEDYRNVETSSRSKKNTIPGPGWVTIGGSGQSKQNNKSKTPQNVLNINQEDYPALVSGSSGSSGSQANSTGNDRKKGSASHNGLHNVKGVILQTASSTTTAKSKSNNVNNDANGGPKIVSLPSSKAKQQPKKQKNSDLLKLAFNI